MGESAGGGDGAAAETGEVMAAGMGDFLDEAEGPQAPKSAGDAGGRHFRQGEYFIGDDMMTQLYVKSISYTISIIPF